jgi:putative photosynthetic complex assembly protein
VSDFRHERFPVGALYGAAGVIGITMALVFGMRFGIVERPETAPQHRVATKVRVIAEREFRFSDRADGALVVTDATTDKVAMLLEPGSNSGFIRGTMRGIVRERMLHEVDRNGPVKITQWADGALTLTDPSTGRVLELGSFGQTNREAYAVLLSTPPGETITIPAVPGGTA